MADCAPGSVEALCALVVEAGARGEKLELRGGGSKVEFGASRRDARVVSMAGFSGVVDYDPPELVLTVWAGTPLAEISALVAREGQGLAFAPFDHGAIYGQAVGAATIGGVVAAGVAGSARLSTGGVRDHLLGFTAVSGRGEYLVGGAKVVKNVTGYDLPKLMAGSWGRLAALVQVTLKVLPAPAETVTLVVSGLAAGAAQVAMARAMGCQAEVVAAGHVPGVGTAFRIEGVAPSVAARSVMLRAALQDFGPVTVMKAMGAASFWERLRDLRELDAGRPLWRVSVPPRGGPAVVAGLDLADQDWLFDWAGGLVWVATEAAPETVRGVATAAGGHAVLVRGDERLRARVPALHPAPAAVARLERRVRLAFDPAGVFETGRFLDMADAD